MARLLRLEGDRNLHSVIKTPGRLVSLASVGLLFVSAVTVALVGANSGVRSAGTVAHVVGASRDSSSAHAANANHPGPDESESIPLQINVGSSLTSSLSCPVPNRPVTSVLSTDASGGTELTASTFCRHSRWYVSARLGTTTAKAFVLPDDPPIPPSVIVSRFVDILPGSLPGILVDRDDFGNASLYELLSVRPSRLDPKGPEVEPVALAPGASPILLLKGASLLQGSGFTCNEQSSGEVIRQYQWYIVNPTTVQTNPSGQVTGNPAVFLQTTVYSAVSPGAFTDRTLPIATQSYRSVQSFTGQACGDSPSSGDSGSSSGSASS